MPSRNSQKRKRRVENHGPCDLHVVLPKEDESTDNVPIVVVVDQLLNRLASIGYQTVALTHTIYGRPRQDLAEQVLPDSLWKKFGKAKTMRVVRRLHAVVENLSDLSAFMSAPITTTTTTEKSSLDTTSILQGYNLVSVAPRNDAVFQETCVAANAIDIITLDYSVGRGGLPFKLRASSISLAVARGVVFEIPYAPAILNKHLRKHLISTCRELQVASLGTKAKVLLSSGSRIHQENDVGAMALRTPDDVVNLAKTVLQFDGNTSVRVNGKAGHLALENGEKRRFGDSKVTSVYVGDGSSQAPNDKPQATKVKAHDQAHQVVVSKDQGKNDDDDGESHGGLVEDGFIAF